MITKKKIRNWETIKNNDGKYNSVMDEINRNFTVSKKIKSNLSVNELFKKVLIGLHQSFNINNEIKSGLKFSSNTKVNNLTVTVKYEIINFINEEFISILWTNNKDKYWTDFEFRKKANGSILVYSESVLREDTISGIQGTIDIAFYKRSYNKNYKKWFYIINKTESDIKELIQKAEEIENKAELILKSNEYINSLNTYNKFKGLLLFKKARRKIEKLDKKNSKLKFKANSVRYNIFILENRWIEFVDKKYQFNKEE